MCSNIQITVCIRFLWSNWCLCCYSTKDISVKSWKICLTRITQTWWNRALFSKNRKQTRILSIKNINVNHNVVNDRIGNRTVNSPRRDEWATANSVRRSEYKTTSANILNNVVRIGASIKGLMLYTQAREKVERKILPLIPLGL